MFDLQDMQPLQLRDRKTNIFWEVPERDFTYYLPYLTGNNIHRPTGVRHPQLLQTSTQIFHTDIYRVLH